MQKHLESLTKRIIQKQNKRWINKFISCFKNKLSMKNYILLFALSLCNNIYAQQITIDAYSDPNSTQSYDQVIIGFAPSATIGVDSKLGEEDITNEPINEFSLRAVQRDKDSYDCMVDTAGNTLVYPNHMESKIDLRDPNNSDLRNAYFEIMPNGIFQAGFSLNLENYHSPEAKSGYLNLATKTDCEDNDFSFFIALSDQAPFYILSIIVTPFDVNFLNEPYAADIPYFTKLYVHMEQDILSSTSTSDEFQKSGIAFPNPTSGELTLDWCGSAELISISGQRIAIDKSDECTKYFNLDHLPSGPYYMKLSDDKNKYQMTLKLIKM